MRISDWSSDVCSSDLSKIAILSGGGDVENAGAITGASGGVYIQGTALDSDDRSGATGSLANSGAIRGTGDFGGSDGDGYGVGLGSDRESATLDNSGDIASDFGVGVHQGPLANAAGAVAQGATINSTTSTHDGEEGGGAG